MNTRLTRAMDCMRPWSRIGLSTYMVCRLGASKPVSHISRTIATTRNGILGIPESLARAPLFLACCVCGAASPARSEAEPVITTFIVALARHRRCTSSGRRLDELTVEFDADAPTHADHHRLALQRRRRAGRSGIDYVPGDQLQPLSRSRLSPPAAPTWS